MSLMKSYSVQAVALYALGLALACFLNMDKLLPWYEQKTLDMDSPLLQTLHDADAVRESSGIGAAVDSFDCAASFLFNDTYKDNSKCFELQSEAAVTPTASASPSATWRELSAAQRRKASQMMRRRLRELASEGVVRASFSFAPGDGPNLTVISTGSHQTNMAMGLSNAIDAQQESEAELPPRSVLVVGDSLALGLATPFERALKEYNEEISFARVGKVSSGLAIPHLFDWEKKVQVLIDKYKPDLIVVMMGINDANNNIRVDDRKAILGTAAWPDAYQERVKRFISIISEKGTPTYWVGLPVVRDEAMTQRIEIANSAAKKACTEFEDCHFIDTWNILTDDKGNYTNYKKDRQGYTIRIREQDGIHFSTEGGDLLSRHILDYISQFVQLRPEGRTGKSI